jgi:predicted transcriptional regulator
MTKLVDKAIKRMRDLPKERQDAVAARVLEIIEDKDPWTDLPPAVQASQLAAIREGLAALERGEIVEQYAVDAWVDSLPRKPGARK